MGLCLSYGSVPRGFGDSLQEFGNGKGLVKHRDMVDLTHKSLAVFILAARDENHRQMVAGGAQAWKSSTASIPGMKRSSTMQPGVLEAELAERRLDG